MPIRVPKHLHIVVRPVFEDDGVTMKTKTNKAGNEVPVTKRITVLPGTAFKFTEAEVAAIEASHGDGVLQRAFGPLDDKEDPLALPAGPGVGGDAADEADPDAARKRGGGKDKADLPGDDDL